MRWCIARGRENIREIIGQIEIASFLRLVWLTNARVGVQCPFVPILVCILFLLMLVGLYIYIYCYYDHCVISKISNRIISLIEFTSSFYQVSNFCHGRFVLFRNEPILELEMHVHSRGSRIIIIAINSSVSTQWIRTIVRAWFGHGFPIGRVIQNWICL